MRSHEFGIEGEALAARYLRSRGYTILERNWRHGKAEVDIIARKDDTLAAVEVKTRSTEIFGAPENFIDRNKIRMIGKAMNAYVNIKQLDLEIRFDFIGVLSVDGRRTINHLKGACYIFE